MHTAATWAALTLAVAPVTAALAQTSSPQTNNQGASDTGEASHEQRLADQEQRIKILERKLELASDAATAAAASTPVVKSAPSGFSLNSADGKNTFKLRGTLNIDGRYFADFDDTANLTNSVPGTSAYNSANGFLTRKIRPYFEGTVNGIYDFRFQPDFAGGRTVLLDTYIAARFKPWAVVTAGKFKNPVGLERLQTEQYNKFIELGFPSSLAPNRDLGLQFSGSVLNGSLNYAAGVFDGTIDGNGTESNPSPDTDTDNKREVAARVFVLPFANGNNFYLRGLGVGIAATSGSKQGNADVSLASGSATSATTQVVPVITTNTWLPSYRTAAQQTLFSYRGDNAVTLDRNEATYADGKHTRLAPQAYYYYGSLGLIAEYTESKQEVSRHTSATATRSDTLKNTAWQVAASYFLTGEDAAYNSATPRNNFALGSTGTNRNWGAWEIAARYQKLNIDDNAFVGGSASFANPATAVSAASGYGVAVNWYLNQNIRWTLEYDHTSFEGGAGTTATVTDRKDENAYVTRFALGF
jgi:phosphate-selective porin OprO/OprP